MAHKKGQGSVKNGRDSNSKGAVLKNLEVNTSYLAISSCVNAVRNGNLEKMLDLEKTTLFFHWSKVM